jgi:hypothetical protein
MKSNNSKNFFSHGRDRIFDSRVLDSLAGDRVVTFAPGDYVKFEIKNDATGESEWMWLRVDYCDESRRLVFGWLDSEPVAFTEDLKLGQQLAVSYDNVRDHKKSTEF